MRRAAATFLAFLALGGCTREEARARLQDDIHADTVDIIHARFPCHSPDLHFFGYRFRVIQKGEYGDGDICWNMSTHQWSWRFLPGATSMGEPSRVEWHPGCQKDQKSAQEHAPPAQVNWPGGWRTERQDDDGPRREPAASA